MNREREGEGKIQTTCRAILWSRDKKAVGAGVGMGEGLVGWGGGGESRMVLFGVQFSENYVSY